MGAESKGAPLWRRVCTEALPGPENMAIDEVLLESFRENPERPIFRTYRWSPAAVSLGRFQTWDEDIFPETCAERGFSIVRRITGGGAIFHDHELTYSLVCGRRDLGSMTVKESFRVLCSFLIDAYRNLGLDAAFALDLLPSDRSIGVKTVHCFAGKEPYDILVGGRKLGGNAQRRLGELVFQHGSIPLTLDLSRQRGLFHPRALPPEGSATALYGELAQAAAAGATAASFPAPEALFALLEEGFAERMGIAWEEGGLTAEERERAEKLAARKYRSEAWNREGKEQLR